MAKVRFRKETEQRIQIFFKKHVSFIFIPSAFLMMRIRVWKGKKHEIPYLVELDVFSTEDRCFFLSLKVFKEI